MLAASGNFAFMAATVKLSGGQVPLMQQIFFRNFIIFLLAFFTMKKQGISFAPSKKAKKDLFFLKHNIHFLFTHGTPHDIGTSV